MAAKSRSSAAIFPFMSIPEPRVAILEATTSRKHEKDHIMSRRMSEPVASNPRPAATVVVLRDSSAGLETFMVRRHEATAFMGGAHVFPGGRVDPADHAGNEAWCDGIAQAEAATARLNPRATASAGEATAYCVAAAREL